MVRKIFKYILIIVLIIICLFTLNAIFRNDNKVDNTNNKKTNNDITNNVLTEEELDELDLEENDNIGNLEIPKINLKADIKEGIDMDTINSYIGHFTNSSVWDGNIALASHNRGSEVKHYFEKINTLEKGDTIIYRSELGERRYEVYLIREIEYTDWSVTENTDENIITLITCITNKPECRLCVQGKLIK